MGLGSEYLDDSTEQNMKTIAKNAQTGKTVDKIAKSSSHIAVSQGGMVDKKVDPANKGIK